MNCHLRHFFLLVVIDYLNFGWAGRTIRPLEADSPLIVDANAVLSFAISGERFKPVSWKSSKIQQRCSRIETVELESRYPLVTGEGIYSLPVREFPRAFVAIACDHE
jgi:hypothetical protein